MKTVKLIPYKYWSPLAGVFQEMRVWVDSADPSPDPSKLLLWGWDDRGQPVAGDFKRQFTRDGGAVTVEYDITGCHGHSEEQVKRVEAVKAFLNGSVA